MTVQPGEPFNAERLDNQTRHLAKPKGSYQSHATAPIRAGGAPAADWAAYEASLSERERQACRLQWVARVLARFERLWDDKAARLKAHEFGWTHRLVVHAAFDARQTKDDATLALLEMFEAQREEAA